MAKGEKWRESDAGTAEEVEPVPFPHLMHLSLETQESRLYNLALRSLCILAREAGEVGITEELERQLVVTASKIQRLSGCRVGDDEDQAECFGTRIRHWRRLWQACRAENIVVFSTSSSRFYVVSSKPRGT